MCGMDMYVSLCAHVCATGDQRSAVGSLLQLSSSVLVSIEAGGGVGVISLGTRVNSICELPA